MLYWSAVGKFEAKHGEDGTNSDVWQQFARTGHKRKSSQDHNPERMQKEYQATEEKVQNFKT